MHFLQKNKSTVNIFDVLIDVFDRVILFPFVVIETVVLCSNIKF